MYFREWDIKNRVKELKNALINYERISCGKEDLENTDYTVELYSDDLYIFRSESDKFVYIHDNGDNTDGKLSVEDLKLILESIASREIDEKYELHELELFLSTEDDE
jgi:hypothetical protein